MARRDREPALRLHLSPSCEAIVTKTRVVLFRGDRHFILNEREAKKLIETIPSIGTAGFAEDLLAALEAAQPEPEV